MSGLKSVGGLPVQLKHGKRLFSRMRVPCHSLRSSQSAKDVALALNLTPTRGGYSGSCPCCGYPTGFTLTEEQGKTLFYCHAGGCRADEIMQALRFKGVWASSRKSPFSQFSSATVAIPATHRPSFKNAATENSDSCGSPTVSVFHFDLWQASLPAQGTPAETYLRGRGISCSLPSTLRFHPRCWHKESRKHHQAMLAMVTPWQGSPMVALHRTYLRPDGAGKADITSNKMSLGPIKGCSVHFAEPQEVLAVTEGIETGLSVWQETRIPTWAALSWGGIKNLILPPLPKAAEVIICADYDPCGLKGAALAAERWLAEGRCVKIAKPMEPGTDFNDLLQAKDNK